MELGFVVILVLMVLLALTVVSLYHIRHTISHTPFFVFLGALTILFQLYAPHFSVTLFSFEVSPLWMTVLPALLSGVLLVQQHEGRKHSELLVFGLILAYLFSAFFTMTVTGFTHTRSQALQLFISQYAPMELSRLMYDTAIFAVSLSGVLLVYRFLHHRVWGRASALILSLWTSLVFTFFLSPFETMFPLVFDITSIQSYLFGVTVAALTFGVILFGYYYFFSWEKDTVA